MERPERSFVVRAYALYVLRVKIWIQRREKFILNSKYQNLYNIFCLLICIFYILKTEFFLSIR